MVVLEAMANLVVMALLEAMANLVVMALQVMVGLEVMGGMEVMALLEVMALPEVMALLEVMVVLVGIVKEDLMVVRLHPTQHKIITLVIMVVQNALLIINGIFRLMIQAIQIVMMMNILTKKVKIMHILLLDSLDLVMDSWDLVKASCKCKIPKMRCQCRCKVNICKVYLTLWVFKVEL